MHTIVDDSRSPSIDLLSSFHRAIYMEMEKGRQLMMIHIHFLSWLCWYGNDDTDANIDLDDHDNDGHNDNDHDDDDYYDHDHDNYFLIIIIYVYHIPYRYIIG